MRAVTLELLVFVDDVVGRWWWWWWCCAVYRASVISAGGRRTGLGASFSPPSQAGHQRDGAASPRMPANHGGEDAEEVGGHRDDAFGDRSQNAVVLPAGDRRGIIATRSSITEGRAASSKWEADMPVIHASTLANGNPEGAAHGATISLILGHSEPGKGLRLHRHPNGETWVVQEGSLTFQLGDTRHNARPGDIIIAPANVPHKFTNDGPGRSNLVCIHASPTFRTEWLE